MIFRTNSLIHILASLGGDIQEILSIDVERVDFVHRATVLDANVTSDHVYFPQAGLISIIVPGRNGDLIEAGIVGPEGMFPLAAVLDGNRSPFRYVAQIAGYGYRIERTSLQRAVERNTPFRHVLMRFVEACVYQMAFTIQSNAIHSVDQRLARWLLMCEDRVGEGPIEITHDHLAILLGVRRPSVTDALHVLEGLGLVRSRRGSVTIRDRRNLVGYAADAYGRAEAEYTRIFAAFLPDTADPPDANRRMV